MVTHLLLTGDKKLLVWEVGWGVEVAMGNLFGFWQPGPRPDNGSCSVFVFFLNCRLPTTPLHLWKVGVWRPPPILLGSSTRAG